MTQSNDLSIRVQQLENGQIDLKLAVSSLIATVERHQSFHETTDRNIRAMIAEMREMRTDFREVQAEVRGLQIENRRILDVLQGLTDGQSE